MFLKLGGGGGIPLAERAEQFFGLVLELIQVRPKGKSAIRHDEPPYQWPEIRWRRAKRRFIEPCSWNDIRWTLSCPRTGGALHT
jgi:hypothetical protein